MFLRRDDKTTAKKLNSDQEIEFTGALHRNFWQPRGKLSPALHLLPGFETLPSEASSEQASSLGSVLRGARWGLLFLELTGRCNERCAHCYADASPEVMAAIDRATAFEIIDDAAALGFPTLQLTGGDPLLSGHLIDCARRATDHGMQVEVYTNGLALNPKTAAKLAALGADMALSVYSHRPEVHDAVTRTPGSWERTLRAIGYARKAGIKVRVGVVLRGENEHDSDQLKRLLADHGVAEEKIGIDRERPVGRGEWAADQDEPPTAANSMHASATRPADSGKLAILYDGRVAPCIFDRDTILGRIAGTATLRSILDKAVSWPSPLGSNQTRSALPLSLPTLSTEGEPLACGECRARRKLLKTIQW